mmetsp:Transcript_16011/g.41096  ORF Transcript_16011/g.41096 Transcript_16011/m.41096 type:complete len:140 (-) Transcript_16011:93-512(-)
MWLVCIRRGCSSSSSPSFHAFLESPTLSLLCDECTVLLRRKESRAPLDGPIDVIFFHPEHRHSDRDRDIPAKLEGLKAESSLSLTHQCKITESSQLCVLSKNSRGVTRQCSGVAWRVTKCRSFFFFFFFCSYVEKNELF